VTESTEQVKITFIESSGIEKTVSANIGVSVMSVAAANMVEGIDADCGGGCACGTCRIYAETNFPEIFDAPDDMESAMLEFAAEGDLSQRLACQITINSKFDGVRIKVVE
jgi:2Fe-2S ferredoxin|tara:strand:- start:499 stop:828 length:330 start_codon:yes stop_codon:yes gene_type:complete